MKSMVPFVGVAFMFLVAVACCAFVHPASASVIGSLSVANSAGGGVELSATTITWLPPGTQAGTGSTDTGAGTNLTYSGGTVGPGVMGNIKNLIAGGGAVDQFMTFPAVSPALDFVLTGLGPGSASTNCTGLSIGGSCSVFAGSPFILTSLGTSTVLSFSANGTIADGGVTGLWSGAFSTQLNASAAAIQATILAPGGSVTSTYSGQFNVTSPASVPEPSTMLLLGFGLIGVVGIKRRSKE